MKSLTLKHDGPENKPNPENDAYMHIKNNYMRCMNIFAMILKYRFNKKLWLN